MNLIFDTNSVYYLDNQNVLSIQSFNKLKDAVSTGKLRIYISPITVIEMASRIEDEKKGGFKKVKDALKKLMHLNPSFLLDPDEQLMNYYSSNINISTNTVLWRNIIETIVKAKSKEQLLQGYVDMPTKTIRTVYSKRISDFRENYERNYINDMNLHVTRLIPGFAKKVSRQKVTRLPKIEKEVFKNYIQSENWNVNFYNGLASRVGYNLQLENNCYENLKEKLHFFKSSYEALLNRIFINGYIPNWGKKNDYNDLHFNVYFHDNNDFVFITSENNVVFEELKKNGRLKNINELVNSFFP